GPRAPLRFARWRPCRLCRPPGRGLRCASPAGGRVAFVGRRAAGSAALRPLAAVSPLSAAGPRAPLRFARWRPLLPVCDAIVARTAHRLLTSLPLATNLSTATFPTTGDLRGA